MTQRAVSFDRELQHAIANRLADVKRFAVGRNANSIRIIEIVCDDNPFLAAWRQIENLSNDRSWYRRISIWTEHRRVSAAVRSYNDVIDSADEFVAIAVSVPTAELLAV